MTSATVSRATHDVNCMRDLVSASGMRAALFIFYFLNPVEILQKMSKAAALGSNSGWGWKYEWMECFGELSGRD